MQLLVLAKSPVWSAQACSAVVNARRMCAQPASEDDQFAKSVLYVKYVRGLAHALSFARPQGLMIIDLCSSLTA